MCSLVNSDIDSNVQSSDSLCILHNLVLDYLCNYVQFSDTKCSLLNPVYLVTTYS